MLERIWSGWRSEYVGAVPLTVNDGGGDEPAGSVFTRILQSGAPDDQTHIVHRSTHCFVIVNIFPYTSGHLLVVPYREVADLDGLDPAETADLWATVTATTKVLRLVYGPDGLNVGLNLGRPAGGSIPNHLHVHVVPRWTGDSNFMSAIANTQTLPESLAETTAKVRDAWAAVYP
jgi:ATP adenylyltransferase